MAIPKLEVQAAPKLMIVSDLDNTMVDHKDAGHQSLLAFNALWEADHAHESLLVFSTGRSPTAFGELASQVPLLVPDVTILSVGTEILYGKEMIPDEGWLQKLDIGWNREIIVEEASKFPTLIWQKDSEQRPHKVSFHVEKEGVKEIISSLQDRLKKRGQTVKIIYSGGYDLDLLPESAGKGQAMAYLLSKLREEGREPASTLACGDSGNDQELFVVPGANGVIVGNAMAELVDWFKSQADTSHLFQASERCASGILQAMLHFGFAQRVSLRSLPSTALFEMRLPHGTLTLEDVRSEIVLANILLERWMTAELARDALEQTIGMLSTDFSMVLPSGKELNREQFSELLESGYGLRVGHGWKLWIDSLRVKLLSHGLFLAKFLACEQSAGGDRVVRASSVILRQKEEGSSSLEWVYLQETLVAQST